MQSALADHQLLKWYSARTARSGITWHALAAMSAMGTGSIAMNACFTDY